MNSGYASIETGKAANAVFDHSRFGSEITSYRGSRTVDQR